MTFEKTVLLKDGTPVNLRILRAIPESQREALCSLLAHKGSVYLNHIADFFERGRDGLLDGLEWRFYLAEAERRFVANICTWEHQGIGILGHVFTRPEWRERGLARQLLILQQEDFDSRGGRIMELNTGFESMPYRLYQSMGYLAVPDAPGSMYKLSNGASWEGIWDKAELTSSPFEWADWPGANLLTLIQNPSLIRISGIGVYACKSLEGPVIHNMRWLWSEEQRAPSLFALKKPDGIVAAVAGILPDPNWGRSSPRKVFDVFFHPSFLEETRACVKKLCLTGDVISYSTPDDPKNPILREKGFHLSGEIPLFFPGGTALQVYSL